jgi:hypothetical protein
MSFPKNLNAPKFDLSNNTLPEPPTPVDYQAIVDGFKPYENRLVLKRDETTTNHPCADDLVVGELVLNAITGNLYTKLVSGQVVYFPGTAVCLTGDTLPSNNYGFILEAPDNFTDSTYNIAKYGVSISSTTGYSIRFNPILSPINGLPQSYNILFASTADGPFEMIARVSAVADYADKGFEFVYIINDEPLPLSAKFKDGVYDNSSLGVIKVEMI